MSKITQSKNELEELYKIHKTLSGVADHLNVSIELLRKKFINLEIDYKKRELYSCNHNSFNNLTEESMYWAGFLLADGGIAIDQPNHKDNRITLELKRTDESHVVKFLNFIKSNHEIRQITRTDDRPEFKTGIYYSSKVRVSSEQIKKDLNNFGVTPRKSKTAIIPDHILNSNLFCHYLRGVIDGDGSVRSDSLRINLCGNPPCIQQIENKLKTINVFGSFRIREDGLGLFGVTKFEYVINLLRYMYEPANESIWLDRKFEEASKIYLTEIKEPIQINRDQLLEYLIQTGSCIETAKLLEVSNSTVKRRVYQYFGEKVFKTYCRRSHKA